MVPIIQALRASMEMKPMTQELRKLSDVPWGELQVGDSLISAIGHPGVITELHPEGQSRYDEVAMIWENGNTSMGFHMNGDYIKYVGREQPST